MIGEPGHPSAAAEGGIGIADAAHPPAPVDWWSVVGSGILLAAGGLWLRSLAGVEAGQMTELGLLSVLPPTYAVAAVLLTLGFAILVTRPVRSGPLLGAYVAAFAGLVHATSLALSGGTLDDAWAWANAGVADHVVRTGDLPITTDALAASTDWPGAAAFAALLADVSGIAPATLAAWFPLVTTLVALLALRVLASALSTDDGIGWMAMWLFVLGSWVGQAHLSPVGLGSMLGLALLAVALPLDRRRGPRSALAGGPVVAADSVAALAAAVCFVGVVAIAVVMTDPVTTLVVALTCALAAATGTSRTLWLSVLLVVAGAAWLVGPARSAIDGELLGWLRVGGSPAQFATLAARPLAALAGEVQLVLIAGRFLTLGLVALAIGGLASGLRRGRPVLFLAMATTAPLVLLAAGSGSEVLLRAFLHALPWVALAGAAALVAFRTGAAATVLRVGVLGALTVGLLVAQSGERGAQLFSAAEVEMAAWLAAEAPPDSLVVTGTWNVPFAEGTVDRTEVEPLTDEAAANLAALAADPAGVLHARLADAPAEGFASAYVLITRSQRHAESVAPQLPDGLLASIEAELRASDRFAVIGENADAVVFTLGGGS